jgi:ribonuclease-3
MHDFSKLERMLGLPFHNADLLKQAFVHRSYLNENPNFHLPHNERLEFLGDAVLELVVTHFLYETYDNPEGELTNWRASLVNSKSLAEVAKKLELNEYLYLSRGESKDEDSKARNYILANAVEALIGALYLDQGYDAAKKLITEHVLTMLPNILQHHLYLDPKSRFQEIAQERLGVTPNYRVLDEVGPDHNKKFTIGVYVGDELIASDVGTSKQEAQVAAAEAALKAKGWDQ